MLTVTLDHKLFHIQCVFHVLLNGSLPHHHITKWLYNNVIWWLYTQLWRRERAIFRKFWQLKVFVNIMICQWLHIPYTMTLVSVLYCLSTFFFFSIWLWNTVALHITAVSLWNRDYAHKLHLLHACSQPSPLKLDSWICSKCLLIQFEVSSCVQDKGCTRSRQRMHNNAYQIRWQNTTVTVV